MNNSMNNERGIKIMNKVLSLVFMLLMVAACSGNQQQEATGEKAQTSVENDTTYREPYRPQFHFTPKKNWMNDPNGLVYYDGEYHMFYQYNPFGIKWGHMSWGHTVSKDMVHWMHLPVALKEENNIMIFSGSAVVDRENTSGLGSADAPPMIAIYAGHHTDKKLQDERIAYSTDRGRSWTKYKNNPVLDEGMENFRDPKIFWYEPDQKWVMVVAKSTEHKIGLYSSKNLKNWIHLSDFGPLGSTAGVWECPDLFKLPVDGNPENTKWVMQVDINPGAVAGGSGGQYFIGDFDGKIFTPDKAAMHNLQAQNTLWVDFGKDFYAVQSWSNIPENDGRHLWIAWMNNWLYGQDIPTQPWRSAMSIPRSLELKTYPEGMRLVQHPVRELQPLRGEHFDFQNQTIDGESDLLSQNGVSGKTLEIVATFEPGDASEVGINVRKGGDEETLVGYDTGQSQLYIDRTLSGKVDFSEDFPGKQAGPMPMENNRVKMHLFVDWSSVEVFGNDGRTVLTDRIFPSSDSDGLQLYSKGGTAKLISMDIWKLNPIWK